MPLTPFDELTASTALRSDMIRTSIFPVPQRGEPAYQARAVDDWIAAMAEEADRVWSTLTEIMDSREDEVGSHSAEIADIIITAHKAANAVVDEANRDAIALRSEASEVLERARRRAEEIEAEVERRVAPLVTARLAHYHEMEELARDALDRSRDELEAMSQTTAALMHLISDATHRLATSLPAQLGIEIEPASASPQITALSSFSQVRSA
jgi:F0F1-type ATP synthase membrane subunit b/b'